MPTLADTLRETSPELVELMRATAAIMDRIASGDVNPTVSLESVVDLTPSGIPSMTPTVKVHCEGSL